MMTNASITVYNRYLDPATRSDAYKRHVIHDVFFTGLEAAIRSQAGANKDDKVFISIPFSSVNPDECLEPIEYKKRVDKDGYFTLSPGDRVVKGEIDLEITGSVSELDKNYEAYTITSVSTRDYGSPHMRHWAVTAK